MAAAGPHLWPSFRARSRPFRARSSSSRARSAAVPRTPRDEEGGSAVGEESCGWGRERSGGGQARRGGEESPQQECVGGERESIFPSPLPSETVCLSVCVSLLETVPLATVALGEAKMELPLPMPHLLASV